MGEINGTFTGCDKCGCTIPGWHHVINGKTCPNMATETNATVIENGKLRSEVERLNAEIATLTDKYNAAIQQLADLNRHVAILETALKQSRDSILEAIWLYDELSMSPLEAAVKHGPDYTPPLDTDILAVREKLDKSRIFMRPTIEEIGGHMDATILNIYIQVQQAVIEMEAMKAENEARRHCGEGPAYTEDSFFSLIGRLDNLRVILMEKA